MKISPFSVIKKERGGGVTAVIVKVVFNEYLPRSMA